MIGKKDITIITLVCVVAGLFGLQGLSNYTNQVYEQGVTDGVNQLSLAVQQTALDQGYLDISFQNGEETVTERFWAETIIQQQLNQQPVALQTQEITKQPFNENDFQFNDLE